VRADLVRAAVGIPCAARHADPPTDGFDADGAQWAVAVRPALRSTLALPGLRAAHPPRAGADHPLRALRVLVALAAETRNADPRDARPAGPAVGALPARGHARQRHRIADLVVGAAGAARDAATQFADLVHAVDAVGVALAALERVRHAGHEG